MALEQTIDARHTLSQSISTQKSMNIWEGIIDTSPLIRWGLGEQDAALSAVCPQKMHRPSADGPPLPSAMVRHSDQLVRLPSLFHLLKKDYTLLQLFQTSSLSFETIPICYSSPRCHPEHSVFCLCSSKTHCHSVFCIYLPTNKPSHENTMTVLYSPRGHKRMPPITQVPSKLLI